MLAGKMSNDDEDAVEEELEAMEREREAAVAASRPQNVPSMPDAPKITAGELPDAPAETPEERQRARRLARAARDEREPIAA
jgi:charged multivesicular body protein 6